VLTLIAEEKEDRLVIAERKLWNEILESIGEKS